MKRRRTNTKNTYNYKKAYLKIGASLILFVLVFALCKISPTVKQKVNETLYNSYDFTQAVESTKSIAINCISKVQTFNQMYFGEE